MPSSVVTALGFDFGMRRIGVAVGQTITATANDLAVINVNNGEPDWAAVDKLVAQWRPQVLVLGIPYNADGSDHAVTCRVRDFATHMEGRFALPVSLVDERLTSRQAHAELKRERQAGRRRLKKGDIDSRSARLVLESWLHNAAKRQ